MSTGIFVKRTTNLDLQNFRQVNIKQEVRFSWDKQSNTDAGHYDEVSSGLSYNYSDRGKCLMLQQFEF